MTPAALGANKGNKSEIQIDSFRRMNETPKDMPSKLN